MQPERYSAAREFGTRAGTLEPALPELRSRAGRPQALPAVRGSPARLGRERLEHASATVTLTVHRHVHPGMGRQATDRFTTLLEG
ncbi:hypothetical protein [Geodermatophilus sp. SYSU D00804]